MPGELVRDNLNWSALPKRARHSLLAKSFAFVLALYVAQIVASPVFWSDVGNAIGYTLIAVGNVLVN